MTLNYLAELYLKDIKTRFDGHKHLLEIRILTYLGNKPINLITPADVRNWQNTQISTGEKSMLLHPRHLRVTEK